MNGELRTIRQASLIHRAWTAGVTEKLNSSSHGDVGIVHSDRNSLIRCPGRARSCQLAATAAEVREIDGAAWRRRVGQIGVA